jgi:hypothetical protein
MQGKRDRCILHWGTSDQTDNATSLESMSFSMGDGSRLGYGRDPVPRWDLSDAVTRRSLLMCALQLDLERRKSRRPGILHRR